MKIKNESKETVNKVLIKQLNLVNKDITTLVEVHKKLKSDIENIEKDSEIKHLAQTKNALIHYVRTGNIDDVDKIKTIVEEIQKNIENDFEETIDKFSK